MSYTPEDQEIAPVCRELLKNIDQFNDVVSARVNAEKGSWTECSLEELTELAMDLLQFRLRIRKYV